MTTLYNRQLARDRNPQAWAPTRIDTRTRAQQTARGASQQPQHFQPHPQPGQRRRRIDWLTVLSFGAAVAALAFVVAVALAQRERFEHAMEEANSDATLAAVTRAERDGYERAMAEITTVVQAAWRSGVVDGMRTCGKI